MTSTPTCRPWCASHLIDSGGHVDVCLGPELRLDFGDHGTHAVSCSDVIADLSVPRDGGEPSIMMTIDAEPVADLDRHQAAAIAWALLSQVAHLDGDPDAADYYRQLAESHAAAAREATP